MPDNREEPAFPCKLEPSDAQKQSGFHLADLHKSGLTKRELYAATANDEDVRMAWQAMSKDKPEGFVASRSEVRFYHADRMLAASKEGKQ